MSHKQFLSLYLDILLNYGLEQCQIDGLGRHFVHVRAPGLLDVVVFDVAGAGHDEGLLDLVLLVELPDALGGHEAIDDGHAQVHENHAVDVLALEQRLLHDIDGVLAIVGAVHDIVEQVVADLPEQQLKTQDVVWLVVDDQDALQRGEATRGWVEGSMQVVLEGNTTKDL